MACVAGDVQGVSILLGNLALAHLFLAEDQCAADALSEQLELWRERSLGDLLDEPLLCSAAIAARSGALRGAAVLAGAATTAVESSSRMAAEEVVFRRIQDEILEPVRQADPAAWDEAERVGRAHRARCDRPRAANAQASGPRWRRKRWNSRAMTSPEGSSCGSTSSSSSAAAFSRRSTKA